MIGTANLQDAVAQAEAGPNVDPPLEKMIAIYPMDKEGLELACGLIANRDAGLALDKDGRLLVVISLDVAKRALALKADTTEERDEG